MVIRRHILAKTQRHGRERRIAIGPKAESDPVAVSVTPGRCVLLFPADSDAQRHASMRARRKTKVQPSQQNKRKLDPLKHPKDRYTKDSYNRAVARAVGQAAGMKGHPRRPEPPKGKTKKSAEYLAMYQQYREACKIWNAKLAEVYLESQPATPCGGNRNPPALWHRGREVALGHSKADVTQVYAERDYTLAAHVASEIG